MNPRYTLAFFRHCIMPLNYLHYLQTPQDPIYDKLKICHQWVFLQDFSLIFAIFQRLYPNFGFESHKRVLYSVLNVSIVHTDDLRQRVMPSKCLQYLQALRPPCDNLKFSHKWVFLQDFSIILDVNHIKSYILRSLKILQILLGHCTNSQIQQSVLCILDILRTVCDSNPKLD